MTHAQLGRELEGLLVVSIEQAVAAPYCGLLLADAGARVIKVERKEGDFARAYDRAAKGHSAYFVWLNRGKESLVLDLDAPDDLALLRRVLRKADVLLQNLAPGALEKRGLSGDVLRRDNPGLICCEITGYGRTGPMAAMKAYDLLVQAETGLCSITGTPDGPARVGVSVCDIATGLTAFSAILRALILRGKTKRGVDLSIAMFDVLADWMNVPLLYQRYAGRAPQRMGVAHATLAPYGLYQAGDGKAFLIAVQSNREWVQLCETLLEQPALAQDERFRDNEDRCKNRAAMDDILNQVFQRYERDALIQKLIASRIACARLSSVEDLDAHPHLAEQVAQMAGETIELADLPVARRGDRPSRVPSLGEDTMRIRDEFSV
jgi:itaconate CoA-transferase